MTMLEIEGATKDFKNRIAELKSERDKMRFWVQRFQEAADYAGLDLCPCRSCGRALLAIPDGLPYCKECAIKDSDPERGEDQ